MRCERKARRSSSGELSFPGQHSKRKPFAAVMERLRQDGPRRTLEPLLGGARRDVQQIPLPLGAPRKKGRDMVTPGIVHVVWAAGTANGQENAMSEGNRWNRKSLLRTAPSPSRLPAALGCHGISKPILPPGCKPWIGRDRVRAG